MDCADHCICGDGDTDGAGNRILHRVLNKEEAFWSFIPGRFVTQPHSNLQLCKLNDGTYLTPDRQRDDDTQPHSNLQLCKLNDGTYLTPDRQRDDDAASYLVNSWSQAIAKFGCYSIFYPKTVYHEILR